MSQTNQKSVVSAQPSVGLRFHAIGAALCREVVFARTAKCSNRGIKPLLQLDKACHFSSIRLRSLSLDSCPLSLPRQRRGFTLLELLVVVGLVAALSFFLLSSLSGGGKSAALQTAQAALANLVSAARVKALAGGGARLLVNVDPASAADPARFLRYAAIQVQVAGVWQPAPVVEIYLPEGIYVVPGNFTSIPAGLFSAGTATPWTKSDGSALRSTALRANQVISAAINSLVAEQWVSVSFASAGTTAQSGDLILATGHRRQPGSFAEGESPVELENPETVRGLTLSTYGLPALINDRVSF